MPNYHPGDSGWICEDCGAYVADRGLHDDHHMRLEEVAESAATAYQKSDTAMGFHTPLGH